jgi:hypothetical protein
MVEVSLEPRIGKIRGKNLEKDIHTKPNRHTVRHGRNKRRVQFPLPCCHLSGKSEESFHANIQKQILKEDVKKNKSFVKIIYFALST